MKNNKTKYIYPAGKGIAIFTGLILLLAGNIIIPGCESETVEPAAVNTSAATNTGVSGTTASPSATHTGTGTTASGGNTSGTTWGGGTGVTTWGGNTTNNTWGAQGNP